MTPQERALIVQFMNLVFQDMRPDAASYPFADMRRVANEGAAVDGSGFEGTEYEYAQHLIHGYWMNAIIQKLQGVA